MEAIAKMTDIQNASDVREMVDSFYAKVRDDEILGIIFDQIVQVDWDEHLPVMYQFWETILLHQEGYRGNPVEAHVLLDSEMRYDHNVGLESVDFDRWIELFTQTIDHMFQGPRAEMAKRGAGRMSNHMQTALLI